MKKINIVRKNIEFNNIIKVGKKYKNDVFYIYMLENNYKYNRYGIAISTKIGNAVVRNKYKRQIKDIIDDIDINICGYDLIFIARSNIKNIDYSSLKSSIIKIFNIIGECNEKK